MYLQERPSSLKSGVEKVVSALMLLSFVSSPLTIKPSVLDTISIFLLAMIYLPLKNFSYCLRYAIPVQF